MKKFLVTLALIAATVSVMAQTHTVSPATTNGTTFSTLSGPADNATLTLNKAQSKVIPIWLNPDGSFPATAGVFVSVVGTNALSTNTLTFTFKADVGDGAGTNVVTTASQSFTLLAGGTTVVSTNVAFSSSIFALSKGARLMTIAADNNASDSDGYTIRIGGVGRRY